MMGKDRNTGIHPDTDRNIASDEPLWNEFRDTGSRKAFRSLFSEWYSDLCRYAVFYVQDMTAAEDVVLDFFIYLWLHRSSVNISSSFRGYALRSVRNRCLNYIRDNVPMSVSIEEADPLSFLYEYDGMSVEDASIIVWEAVRSLSPKSREVFEKSREEGMSNAEIAASMNLSVKTVEGHMTKALKAIRLALKKNFFLFLINF